MTDYLRQARRALAGWLRSLAGRVDPGWPLPAQYTAGHVLAYHELLIDVGLADAYGAPSRNGHVPTKGGGNNAEKSAPPQGARHDSAAGALRGAHQEAADSGQLSRKDAARVRQAFIAELERLNTIVLDISDSEASEVPIDVTLKALQHFVPVYAAAMSALIGTPGGTE
jgi:hypothetical protein